jgi:hypothetical protein
MAITKQVTTQIVSLREQTWRINFEIPHGNAVPSIQVYRETVGVDAEGNAVGNPQQNYKAVTRTFEAVADEVAPVSGIAFGDIVEALSEFGDKWAQEDADKPAELPPGMPPPAPEVDEPDPVEPPPTSRSRSKR